MARQMRNPLDSTKNWPAVIKAVRDPLGLMALALLAVCVIVVAVLLTGALGEHDPRILIGFIIGAILSLAGFGAVMWGHPGKPSPGGQPGDDSIPDPPGGPKDPPVPGIVAPENGTGSSVSSTIHSPFPVIEVESRKNDEGKPEIVITRMSERAKQFFGYELHRPTHEIVGQPATAVMMKLEGFIDPPRPSWTDLDYDQQRVFKEVEQHLAAYANVPVKFNHKHRDEAFRGKTFIPIITEVRQEQSGEGDTAVLRVLYLDMAKLPKTLFTKTVWNNVIKDFDLNELASEFGKIREKFSNQVFDKDDEEKNEMERADRIMALDSAIESLRNGDPQSLEELSRAGWFRLRKVANKMGETAQRARSFIEEIIGPEPPGIS